MAVTELEVLAARLRLDLESAGFATAPPERADDQEDGARVFVFEDRVHVAWGIRDRLREAVPDMQEAGRTHEKTSSAATRPSARRCTSPSATSIRTQPDGSWLVILLRDS
ncbi:hypothetical protein [Streptomyces sp. SAS_270]|uniref:hypothetical protein n=1 Tax=Streptomyces sp. SAS_270 TaxID=3412748 RepID=UPI00403C9CA9